MQTDLYKLMEEYIMNRPLLSPPQTKPSQSNLPKWVTSTGIFLLKSLAWIALGALTIFLASYFIKFPSNRVDLFSVLEVLFGIVITALAIVASFSVSSQWREFESDVREYAEKVSKIAKEANVNLEKLQEISSKQQSLREALDTYQAKIEGIGEKLTELGKLSNDIQDGKDELSNKVFSTLSSLEVELNSMPTKFVAEVTENVTKLIPEIVEKQLKDHVLKVNTDNTTQDDPLVKPPASS
jgi:methyl-accepting chemotaxis protein